MKKTKFSFEDLEVWQKAVHYAGKVIRLTEKFETDRKHYRLIEQLEGSSSSVASNVAEGKGRNSKKEFVQFLYIARGSLFESVTRLIICHANGWINDDELEDLKSMADEIGKMLSSLINSIKNSS